MCVCKYVCRDVRQFTNGSWAQPCQYRSENGKCILSYLVQYSTVHTQLHYKLEEKVGDKNKFWRQQSSL